MAVNKLNKKCENCPHYHYDCTSKEKCITKTYIKMKIEEYNRKRAIAKNKKINDMYVNYIDVLTELLEEE